MYINPKITTLHLAKPYIARLKHVHALSGVRWSKKAIFASFNLNPHE